MTTEDNGELELRDYLDVLKRRKWIIVATTLLVVIAAIGASLMQEKVYRSAAEVLLQSRASERIFNPDDLQQSSSRTQVETEIQVMKSRSVVDAVEATLGHRPSVSISALGETDVVAISAESVVPTEAARIANTYATVYIESRRQALIDDLLQAADQVQAKVSEIDLRLTQLAVDDDAAAIAERQTLLTQRSGYAQQLSQLELAGNLTESGGAQLVSEADAPTNPVRPTPRRNAILALVVGLILGVGLAFLREYLDDSLRSKDDLERATGLSVLAAIPVVPGWRRNGEPRIVSLTDPTSATAEAYRGLRTSLQFLSLDRPLQVIQVTSASAGDGKTTTVANLAVSLARAGQRVVIVDCDLRRPRVHEFFGLRNSVGLTSVLVGEVPLHEAIQAVAGESRLALLASGPLPPNPSELLSSKRTTTLLQSLRESADVVLIDSPPVLPVTDGVVLAGLVDATVMVGTAGRATRRALHRAAETLRLVSAPLAGAVLNGAVQEDGYGYGYGYAHVEPAQSAPSRRRRIEAKRDERAKTRL